MCELGAGVGTGMDGIKGIGSNIMIDFLYILLLLIQHMHFVFLCVYVYYTLLVVICIMFLKLRKCFKMQRVCVHQRIALCKNELL